VRSAVEQDPHDDRYGGSAILRQRLHPDEAPRAFVVETAERSVNFLAPSKTEADACVRGFRLLVAAAKADLKGGGR
jgi:hypothetical protein